MDLPCCSWPLGEGGGPSLGEAGVWFWEAAGQVDEWYFHDGFDGFMEFVYEFSCRILESVYELACTKSARGCISIDTELLCRC